MVRRARDIRPRVDRYHVISSHGGSLDSDWPEIKVLIKKCDSKEKHYAHQYVADRIDLWCEGNLGFRPVPQRNRWGRRMI